jgi:1-acyl-sn-glycerol-3-phosphate acyltransferase
VHQHNFIETKGLSLAKDMKVLKDKTFHLIYNELEKDAKYMKDTNRKR